MNCFVRIDLVTLLSQNSSRIMSLNALDLGPISNPGQISDFLDSAVNLAGSGKIGNSTVSSC